jgi:hypothetical protein
MKTPEEYKLEQQKRISSLKINSLDQSDNKILRILGRGDEYVIYEIESNDLVDTIKVCIDNVTEKDDSGIIKNYNEIRIKFVEVKGYLYKVVDKSAIKSIIAQILIHGITENPTEANKQFDALKITIDTQYKEQFSNKIKLLFSALFLTLLLIVFSISTYYNKYFYDYIHIKNLIFICTAGSVGGFFSISIGLKKIICEKEVSNWLYITYGFERIIISILASTIVYFGIKTDLFFGSINSLTSPIIGYILIAFAAGFSETLIPNLLTKIETEQK